MNFAKALCFTLILSTQLHASDKEVKSFQVKNTECYLVSRNGGLTKSLDLKLEFSGPGIYDTDKESLQTNLSAEIKHNENQIKVVGDYFHPKRLNVNEYFQSTFESAFTEPSDESLEKFQKAIDSGATKEQLRAMFLEIIQKARVESKDKTVAALNMLNSEIAELKLTQNQAFVPNSVIALKEKGEFKGQVYLCRSTVYFTFH